MKFAQFLKGEPMDDTEAKRLIEEKGTQAMSLLKEIGALLDKRGQTAKALDINEAVLYLSDALGWDQE